jgi:thermitase
VTAGVAGLIWAINPALRPITVQRILRDTAIDLGEPGPDNLFGYGRIDAQSAVAIAQVTADATDATPPLAQIDTPTDGETVSGTIRIAASALDVGSGLGVADVTFSLDGEIIATDTAPPFLIALVTNRVAPGQHTLTAIATDEAGNASDPASARIFIAGAADNGGGDSNDGVTPNADNIPPRIALVFPIDGATVSGDVGALATATDNADLARIEWLVDGRILSATPVTGTRANAEFVWRASGVLAGEHTLTARAVDAAGNQAGFSVVLTIP